MTQIQPKPLGPDAVGLKLPEMTFEYTDRDVILYALGVGATELDFVYERNLKTLPTFAVIPAFPAMTGLSAAIEINLVMVLHGEQGFRMHKTIPTRGRLTTTGKVAGVYDKGKGALATVETETRDDNGELIFSNSSGAFVRRAGGLGGGGGAGGRKNSPGRGAGKNAGEADAAGPGADFPPLWGPQTPAYRTGLPQKAGGAR